MILFEKLTAKNFMSIGDNPITLIMNKDATTLITGSNGTGKSTLIVESLTFALFGKSFRGLNKPQLINTVNQRDCLVEIQFSKHTDQYTVIRGMKPTVFTIKKNGSDLNESSSVKDFQEILEEILGFNYSEFTKTIVLGNANYKPFLQLSASERRTFIESMLGLTVFTDMNKCLRGKLTQTKESINSYVSQLNVQKAIYKEKNDFLTHLTDSVQNVKERLEKEIKDLEDQKDTLQHTLSIKRPEIEKNYTEVSQKLKDAREERQNLILDAQEISGMLKKEEKALSYFQDEHVQKCSQCFQKITEEFKQRTVEVTTNLIHDLEARQKEHNELIAKNLDDIKQLEEVEFKLYTDKEDLRLLYSKIVVIEDKIAEKKDKEIYSETNQKIFDLKLDIEKIKMEINIIVQRLEEEKERKKVMDLAVDMLKDTGIKSSIISRYIPMINSYINHYLDVLDFGVQCTLDEQFNDTMKGRFANEFVYANLSQGERTRIDLAILFALRKVAAVCSGASTSVLVLDEICDSSLDSAGVDALFTIIEEACTDQNVFIVSHREDVSAKCKNSIMLSKVGGFTRVA